MIDKKILNSRFYKNKDSYWHCPTCFSGYLVISENTLSSRETSVSEKAHQYDRCEPECVSMVYSCIFECSNKSCGEKVTSSGSGFLDWSIEVDDGGYPQEVYVDCFEPHYFYPPLKIIRTPKSIPEDVGEHINKSFELFFSSPSAAINHVRCALELILNHLKVPRYTNNKGKRRNLNLHQRIERLSKKHPDLQEYLLAIKWVGNNGSHPERKLIKKDLIDLYDILEHVLFEIFDNKSQTILSKAKAINKAKGIK